MRPGAGMEGQMTTESLEDGSVRCSMVIDGIGQHYCEFNALGA